MDYIFESTSQIEYNQFKCLTSLVSIEGIDGNTNQLKRDPDEAYEIFHYSSLIESIPDTHPILKDCVVSNTVSVPTASTSNSQTESTSKTQSASLKTESPISEIFEEAIRQNESRVDVVNKEVVRGCKKKLSVFTKDQLAESSEINKFVKDFIKTRDDGSPEKIEALVDWIEDTFQFSNLCEVDKRKLLPIVIYFLFKSKYETMLTKMLAYLKISNRNKKCKEDGQWLYSFRQMKNEVETFK